MFAPFRDASLGERLEVAAGAVAAAAPADVGRKEDVRGLEAAVLAAAGDVFGPEARWERVLGVNLWGMVHGAQVFAPGMLARGRPGLIVNTGSKQEITTPRGDPACNVSKAGVKAFTEALQHELRTTVGGRVTARLLIPGFVFAADRPRAGGEAGRCLDARADGGLHAGAVGGGRFLHPLPR